MKDLHRTDTLLFDLDDTLIVEVQSADDSFIETIRQIDPAVDADAFVKAIRMKAREIWYALPTIDYCLKIGISSWEGLWADFTGDHDRLAELQELSSWYRFETWKQTLLKFNIPDEKLAEKLSNDFRSIRNSKHVLFPETIDTLQKAKVKYKLGLITNGAPDLQWKKIRGGGLDPYFNYIAISGEQGYAKPDTRLFEIAIHSLQTDKAKSIMIGDTLKTDIKGGRDSGIGTIWVNRNHKEADGIKPDYEVGNLSEIFHVIDSSGS
jgi:putative hydrolase of the HAD superfamily